MTVIPTRATTQTTRTMRRCWKHLRALLRIWSTIVIAPGLLVVGQWATLRATPREVDRDGPAGASCCGFPWPRTEITQTATERQAPCLLSPANASGRWTWR